MQALVLSYIDYCPVVWSSAARKDLVKLQLAQNRVARLALHCNQRADLNTRLTASLLLIRNFKCVENPKLFAKSTYKQL